KFRWEITSQNGRASRLLCNPNNVRTRISGSAMYKRFYAAIGWLLALLLSSTLVAKDWPVVFSDSGNVSPPESSVLTPMGLLLTVGAAAVFFLFAWRAKHRRHIAAVFFVSLIAWQLFDPFIGWDRILFIGFALTTLGMIVESVRQNVVLLKEIRTKDPSFNSRLLRTLYLWIPVATIAYAGYWLDHWFENTATQVVYDTTPI